MGLNLKKRLNLNSYEWWRNHRRFVTLGIFLALFAVYIRTPYSKDFKVRDTCGKLNSSYQITGNEALKKLNLTKVSNFDDRTISNYYCDGYFGLK
tara:strand:+ start:1228 stop:1512 length:285 start_codon:yes stop_codon:yes gene_type:complete